MLLKLIDNNSPVSFIINILLLLVTAVSYVFWAGASFNSLYIVNILSIAVTIYVLNVMSDRFHLFKELTYLSSFIFLLFTLNIQPVLFNTFIGLYLLLFVFYLFLVLTVYNQSDVKHISFNAGFVLGLLYVANEYLLFFGLVLFLMLILSRSFYWREWLLAIIGIFLPVFYVKLFEYLGISLPFMEKLNLSTFSLSSEVVRLYIGSSVLLFVLTLFYLGRKTVRKRNIYTAILTALIVAVLIYFVFNIKWSMVFTIPPMAILITHLYHNIKKQIFRWIILLYVIALSICSFVIQ